MSIGSWETCWSLNYRALLNFCCKRTRKWNHVYGKEKKNHVSYLKKAFSGCPRLSREILCSEGDVREQQHICKQVWWLGCLAAAQGLAFLGLSAKTCGAAGLERCWLEPSAILQSWGMTSGAGPVLRGLLGPPAARISAVTGCPLPSCLWVSGPCSCLWRLLGPVVILTFSCWAPWPFDALLQEAHIIVSQHSTNARFVLPGSQALAGHHQTAFTNKRCLSLKLGGLSFCCFQCQSPNTGSVFPASPTCRMSSGQEEKSSSAPLL